MDRDNSDKMRFSGAGGAGPGGSGAVSVGEGQSWWGSGCPVRCKEHKGMWCCKAPQHQGSPVPAPCHSSCSARWYQPSMSLHPPFSWGNDWVWRFQGITAPAFPMGALQGTAQVLRPPKDGAKDWQMPHTNLPAAPQQSTGTSTGSKPVSAPGSLSVASLDPTASQVASSAPVQPWASPCTSGLAMALSHPQNSKSQDLPQEPPSHSTQVPPA